VNRWNPRRAAWPVPRLTEVVAGPKVTFLDRRSPLLIFAALLLVSGLGHALLLEALGRGRSGRLLRAPRRESFEVTVVEKAAPPPPPPVVPVPAPTPVVPRRRVALAAPRPATASAPAHPLDPTPAPPTPQTPPPTAPPDAVPELAPTLLPGVALSATSVAGTMKVARGGSPGGRASGESEGGGTGNGRPYQGGEFVEVSDLSEEPVFLDNVSARDVERFYPKEARAEHFEASVELKLVIDADGSVAHVTVTSDPGHGLGAAAARLARLYRFKPGKLAGRAVATEIRQTVVFELPP
jgi:TonB family protein